MATGAYTIYGGRCGDAMVPAPRPPNRPTARSSYIRKQTIPVSIDVKWSLLHRKSFVVFVISFHTRLLLNIFVIKNCLLNYFISLELRRVVFVSRETFSFHLLHNVRWKDSPSSHCRYSIFHFSLVKCLSLSSFFQWICARISHR